jgi:hypothetical protein
MVGDDGESGELGGTKVVEGRGPSVEASSVDDAHPASTKQAAPITSAGRRNLCAFDFNMPTANRFPSGNGLPIVSRM